MIKSIPVILLLIYTCSLPGIAQKPGYKDSIELVKAPFGGLKFYQHDKNLTMRDLTNIMRPDPEAFSYLKKAKTNNTLAFISGFIGGALIGYELGSAVGGREINWGVMGAGAGFIVIGIPFDIGGKRNTRKAVSLYNAAFR
jgi:hypothetical protein